MRGHKVLCFIATYLNQYTQASVRIITENASITLQNRTGKVAGHSRFLFHDIIINCKNSLGS